MKQPCYYNHFYMHDEEGMVIYNALVNTKYYEEALKIPGFEDFLQGMKNREQVRIMKKYTAVGAIETQNKIIENMMKPYQCMLNNYVNSFADDIRIGTAN